MTQAFNLGQLANKVNTSGQLDASTGLVNSAAVANGGTGRSTLTAGTVLIGNDTSQVNMLAGTTTNDVLLWSGSAWISSPAAAAGAGGGYQLTSFTSPGTYTKPASLKAVKVTVVGAGGTGGSSSQPGGAGTVGSGGGAGGAAIYYAQAPAIPGPVAVTAGAGTNSFGAIASATAGSAGLTSSSVPNNTVVSGGNGGTASGGTINQTGGGGGAGLILASPAAKASGAGGNSIFGGGGTGRSGFPASNGVAGGAYGAGGSGAAANSGSTTGGAGAPGIVIIEEFF
jgi:hypothetical protein